MFNWETSLLGGDKKERKLVSQVPSIQIVLKFIVNNVAKGKLGLTGIEGVLRNSDEIVLAMFSKHVGCMESNEALMVAILEALQIFTPSF